MIVKYICKSLKFNIIRFNFLIGIKVDILGIVEQMLTLHGK